MCGIVGLLGNGARDAGIVRRMTARLEHRGPDGEGVWSDSEAGVALGHRRLAVVDLTAAGQEPMVSASGRLVVTYNGEIYNHSELRARLDREGRTPDGGWRGHSDIETFLEAIDHWGLEAALAEAVGMFAFALWDRRDRLLRLVRDRFGEKPLYYGWAGRDFLFASELKAITAHPDFERTINRQALATYLARMYVPAPQSIYEAAFKLEPASILTVSGADPLGRQRTAPTPGASDSLPRIERYWDYGKEIRAGLENPFRREEEAVEAIEDCLSSAVRGQSIADVPVGAFLSGGIDSSTVVALYQKHSNLPVRSFTIGFEEDGFDEASQAKEIAEFLGTVHHEQYVTAEDALAVIPQLPSIYDEPFADSSQIPTYLVSKFARSQVTVALTGDGGDEMFSGYNRHFLVPRLWAKLAWLPQRARLAALAGFRLVPDTVLAGLGRLGGLPHTQESARKLRKALHLAGHSRSIEHFAAAFVEAGAPGQSLVAGIDHSPRTPEMPLGPLASDADKMAYLDAVDYLPNDVLCKVDRASMAVSLETRVPFLDHRVATLAARIPSSMKVSRTEGKLLLKTILGRTVPRALFDRPKSGFAIPLEQWLRGPLRPWAEHFLLGGGIKHLGLLDSSGVHRTWSRFAAGDSSETNVVWALLMFEAWAAQQGE